MSWSGAWRTGTAHDDDQPDSDATVELRPFGTRKWDEVWHRVREAASERWGVEVSPDYIPDELDLDEFIVLMHQIEDQVAAEGHIAEYEADDVDAEPEAVTETTCEVTEGVTESTRTKEICGIGDSSDSPAQPMETVEGRDHATSVTASDDVLSVTASGPDSLEEALRDEPLLDRLHDAIEAAVQEKDEPSDERDRSNSANPTGGADGS